MRGLFTIFVPKIGYSLPFGPIGAFIASTRELHASTLESLQNQSGYFLAPTSALKIDSNFQFSKLEESQPERLEFRVGVRHREVPQVAVQADAEVHRDAGGCSAAGRGNSRKGCEMLPASCRFGKGLI